MPRRARLAVRRRVLARDGGAELEREQLLGGVVRDLARFDFNFDEKFRARRAFWAPHLRARGARRRATVTRVHGSNV
jgi:hypothetical protein